MSTERRLTIFGAALYDLFTALVVFNVALAAVFAVSYWYARGVDLAACRPGRTGDIDPVSCLNAVRASSMPGWLSTVNRAVIAATGTLVIGTAIGTAWEMGRARVSDRMVVRIPRDDGPDAAPDEGGDRRSGLDRRDGWGRVG